MFQLIAFSRRNKTNFNAVRTGLCRINMKTQYTITYNGLRKIEIRVANNGYTYNVSM